MDDEPRSGLTKRQRTLLTQARESIRDVPDSYSQLRLGTGHVTCATPACIAGHIIAADPELRAKLETTLEAQEKAQVLRGNSPFPLAEIEAGDAETMTSWSAIEKIAREGLGTVKHPVLFHTEWPIRWARLTEQKPEDRHASRLHNGSFLPTAAEAIAVLDGILDGRIEGALSQG